MKNKHILIGIGSLLAAATAFFFIRKDRNSGSEKPPKKAPQLNLENPGSQDHFPTAPVESEIG